MQQISYVSPIYSFQDCFATCRPSSLCTVVQDSKVTVQAETIKSDFNNQWGKWNYFFVQTLKIVILSIINVQGEEKYSKTNIHLIHCNLEH